MCEAAGIHELREASSARLQEMQCELRLDDRHENLALGRVRFCVEQSELSNVQQSVTSDAQNMPTSLNSQIKQLPFSKSPKV